MMPSLFMPFQEGSQCLNSAGKVANWILVDIIKYHYYPYVIIGKLLAYHYY